MEPSPNTGSRRLVRRSLLASLLLLLLLVTSLVAPVLIRLHHPAGKPERPVAGVDWVIPTVPPSDRHVLLLMIDGLAVEAFRQALDGGAMPNLAGLLERRASSSMVAISTFPSATSPSVPELLSGRYVDLDDLPAPMAVHAFDRDTHEVIRYVTKPDEWQWPVPTLFDALQGRPAVTVFEGRWDGPVSILTQYNIVGQALLEKIGAAALSGGDAGPVEAYLRQVREGPTPSVSLVVLNEFDMTAHFHGPDSLDAQKSLARIDALIGRIVQGLAEVPMTRTGTGREESVGQPASPVQPTLLDRTTLFLFGDHGMVASGQFIDLPDFFSRQGLSAVDVSTISHVLLRERLGTLWTDWADVILVAGGSNVTQIYLKDSLRGWSAPAEGKALSQDEPGPARRPQALAAALVAIDGVDQVMWRDADASVRVVGPGSQEVRILSRGEGHQRRHAYLVEDGDRSDPFGYLDLPATRALTCIKTLEDDCFHSTADWLEASANGDYPGAVALLAGAFKPSRFAGDLMVAARRGYSFLRGQRGDHGNLDRAAMLTPLVINGPGVVACGESQHPRLVDIYPSVAVVLGAAIDDPAFVPLDGRVLDCVARATMRDRPHTPRPGQAVQP